MSGPYGVTELTITIPGTPSSALTPNKSGRRGGHWHALDAKAELRADALKAALPYRNTVGGGPIFAGPVEVTERIVFGKGRRKTDLDAVPLMLKAALDGICDAGIIGDDRQVVRLTVLAHGKDAKGPGWVELTIREEIANGGVPDVVG